MTTINPAILIVWYVAGLTKMISGCRMAQILSEELIHLFSVEKCQTLHIYICSILLSTFLCSCRQVSSPAVWLASILATTPHETPTVRLPASHRENYTGQTSQTRRTLLEKQRRACKGRTTMDPHIWPSKSRTTSPNLHSAAMWGHRM